MITLTNLTPKQKALMEVMWAMDSLESVKAFITTLPTKQDQADCLSMLEIAIVESNEEAGALEEYADLATNIIDRARG